MKRGMLTFKASDTLCVIGGAAGSVSKSLSTVEAYESFAQVYLPLVVRG